jgi:hypothetical protein
VFSQIPAQTVLNAGMSRLLQESVPTSRFMCVPRQYPHIGNEIRQNRRSFSVKAKSGSNHPPSVFQGGNLFTETGGFDDSVADYFLKTYWQKHPVLFRSAFKFESPVTPDELAGLVRISCSHFVSLHHIIDACGVLPGLRARSRSSHCYQLGGVAQEPVQRQKGVGIAQRPI